MKFEIFLDLGDFLPHIPEVLLHEGPHFAGAKLSFDVAELADRISRRETTIPLTEIHRRTPEIFREEIQASDGRKVCFPWKKVARLLAAARAAPGLEPGADGLSPAAAAFLVERMRQQEATRAGSGRAETSRVPNPLPAAAPAPARVLKVVKAVSGRPRRPDKQAAPRAPIRVAPDMRKVAAADAPTVPVSAAGTTHHPASEDDDKLTREELLRMRDALRAQLARTKSEFARQLAAAAQERQRVSLERERFIAEMMRVRAVADERDEQMAFERNVAAKSAEILTKAQEEAWALKRELSAFQAEMAKAHEETDLFIEELIAERNALARGQPLAAHQVAELRKRREFGRTIQGNAARAASALRAPREAPRPDDAAQGPSATRESALTGAADLGETPAPLRSEVAPGARPMLGMLGFSGVLAGLLAAWYFQLSERDGALAAEVRQLDREWVAVSASLDEAARMRRQFQKSIDGARSARDEFDGDDRWTPAVRSIATATNEGIELGKIQVVKEPGNPRTGGLRIEGLATGPAPRAIADRFFQALQRELRGHFPAAGPCRFERLDDEPEEPSDAPDRRRAVFTIIAPVGAAVLPSGATQPETEA